MAGNNKTGCIESLFKEKYDSKMYLNDLWSIQQCVFYSCITLKIHLSPYNISREPAQDIYQELYT